jgi:F-type H+-transporting ATPase subunit a
MGIAFVVLEIFVAALQAYIFAILTAIYIQLALADEH